MKGSENILLDSTKKNLGDISQYMTFAECVKRKRARSNACAVVGISMWVVASIAVLVWICVLLHSIGMQLSPPMQQACTYISIAIVVSCLFPGPGTIIALILLACASQAFK